MAIIAQSSQVAIAGSGLPHSEKASVTTSLSPFSSIRKRSWRSIWAGTASSSASGWPLGRTTKSSSSARRRGFLCGTSMGTNDSLRQRKHGRTFWSDGQPIARPFHEAHAPLLLQGGHHPADSRWQKSHLLSGRPQAAQFDRPDESAAPFTLLHGPPLIAEFACSNF